MPKAELTFLDTPKKGQHPINLESTKLSTKMALSKMINISFMNQIPFLSVMNRKIRFFSQLCLLSGGTAFTSALTALTTEFFFTEPAFRQQIHQCDHDCEDKKAAGRGNEKGHRFNQSLGDRQSEPSTES